MNPITPIRINVPRLGTRIVTARLTAEAVMCIRSMPQTTPLRAFAEAFGCHISTVCNTRRGRTWAWVSILSPTTAPMEATDGA
jgi:hypothetical protein